MSTPVTPAPPAARPAGSAGAPAPDRFPRGAIPRRASTRRPHTRLRAARIAVGLGGAVAVLVVWSALEHLAYQGRVLPGVEVDGVSIAGHGESASFAAVDAEARRLLATPLRARAGQRMLAASPSDFSLSIDARATLRAARRAGRSRNPLAAVWGTVLRRVRPDRLELRTAYDPDALQAVVDRWEREVAAGQVQGGLRFDGTTVVTVPPRRARAVDHRHAASELRRRIEGTDRSVIRLAVAVSEPAVSKAELARAAAHARAILSHDFTISGGGRTATVTPSKVAAALFTTVEGPDIVLRFDRAAFKRAAGTELATLGTAAVDATFAVQSDGSVAVVPSRDGTEPDYSAIGAAILRNQREITAASRPVHPEHDTAWANALGIHELVSTFTTNHAAGQPRVVNIHKAADYLDGDVVEPGQVFSLNDRVGARTEARGFVKAPVYYDDFTEDFGGGVSQLATTTFNAAWWGGYQIVEHMPHTIYFTRYPMGREATVNYPYLDLKFKNDSAHGILIRTHYTSTSITVSFYGDKEGKVVEEQDRKILETIPVTQELIQCPVKDPVKDDPKGDCAKLKPAEQKKIEDGHIAYAVEFYRVIKRAGRPDVRQKYYWRYHMLPDKILVGAPETTTTTTAPAATTTTPPATAPVPTTAAP